MIRRRLIDYIRKESKYLKQIPMTTFDLPDEEEHVVNVVEIKQSVLEYEHQQQAEDRHDEILRYMQKMTEYGITLADLVQSSPKHRDARKNLFSIADILVRDQNMVQYLMNTKTLPIKELLTKVEVSRKTIERNRKYIIALAMIQIYDFYHLKEYLQVDREERAER
ncbi:RNA polymerase subunit sigma [Tepidibacillus marianensis]|uniref:RNA polymerase subunit sigma n=1 Tax=Tepidibacillus marianensis TaxID=3131995 RepID=UPI0030D2387E